MGDLWAGLPQPEAEGVWVPQMEQGGKPKALGAPVEAGTQDPVSGLITLWPERVSDKTSGDREVLLCCTLPSGNAGSRARRVPLEQGCLQQLGVPAMESTLIEWFSESIRERPKQALREEEDQAAGGADSL